MFLYRRPKPMKKIMLSLFALIVLAGTVVPAHAAPRHCYYRHHHRHCHR